MRDVVDTEFSIDRETHQVLVSLDAPGVSIVVAFDPWVDDYALPLAIDELEKELQHAHEVGPNRASELDLIADGGRVDKGAPETRLREVEKQLSIVLEGVDDPTTRNALRSAAANTRRAIGRIVRQEVGRP